MASSDPEESAELKDQNKTGNTENSEEPKKPDKDTKKETKSVTIPATSPLSEGFSRLKKKATTLSSDQPRVRLLAGALLIIISASAGFLGGWAGSNEQNDSQTTIQKQQVVLENQGQLLSNIANNVGQSVVSVNSTQAESGSSTTSSSSLGNLFGITPQPEEEESAGTGIILTSSGLIITNRHVVPAGSTNISVTLSNGTTFNNVKVVGRTSTNDSLDIAFLQIENTNSQKLTPAIIGDSSKMVVGDPVVAIGNALGQYQNTVTSGIISGYGRSVQASNSTGTTTENLTDMFQTDAAINEGNSGGPLVNMDGEVIGINTAIASSAQNIGFAIPIDDVTGLIKTVEQSGKLQQPYLGVYYVPITSDVAKQYNLSVTSGAYIPTSSQANGEQTVISGGPAANAGVQPGDIITELDGTSINQQHSLISVLDQETVGSQVTLTIMRGSKQLNINVTLGSAPTN